MNRVSSVCYFAAGIRYLSLPDLKELRDIVLKSNNLPWITWFNEKVKMLGDKISEHKTKVFLINTGWSGGPYGLGKRIDIRYSRAMVRAALNGSLDIVKYSHDTIFNLDVPCDCAGVPSEILNPKNTWLDKDSYDLSARKLAQMFVDNFTKFKNAADDIKMAGPQITQ